MSKSSLPLDQVGVASRNHNGNFLEQNQKDYLEQF